MMIRQILAALLLFSVAACAGTSQTSQPSLQTSASPVRASPNLLKVADATRENDRFSEAMQIYQEVLVAESTSVAAQYGVAECLLGLGKADDAQPMFDALSKVAGYRALGLQGKGLASLVLGQREQAGKSLHDATEADPKLWRAWNGLGLLADLKHEPQAAEVAYGNALAINADSAALHNNLGYSRLLTNRPDEAIVEFRKALTLDPSSETAQNNFRVALAAKGRYADAIRGVEKDKMSFVLNNVGYVAMARGDLSAAEGYFARAMESSPSFNTITSQNIEQLKAKKGGE
jgi:Flp pilus assembly protein TadD